MFDGDLQEIKDEFSKFAIAKILVKEVTPELQKFLDSGKIGFEVLSINENDINIKFDRSKITIAGVFDKLSPRCSILDLSVQDISIETIVKTLYERKSLGAGHVR